MSDPASPSALDAVLAGQRVLGLLEAPARAALAAQFARSRFAAGEPVAEAGQLRARLGLVVAGEVCLRHPDGQAAVALHAGELFGHGAALPADETPWVAQARTDCEVAFLMPEQVAALVDAHAVLRCFLAPGAQASPEAGMLRPRRATDPHPNLMARPIGALVRREPVTLPPTASIGEAARLMRDRRASSVLIVEQGLLFGLITDRDLRNRVVAPGLDPAGPLFTVATVAPLTVQRHCTVFDAMLLMARHNIHHMPVMDGSRPVGMVTATDVAEQHSTSAVHLAGEIHRQDTVEGLVEVSGRIRQLQRHLADADATALSTGRIVSAMTDAVTTRLLQLAEARLGPAPLPYAWVAAGSQGRAEQTARSDQDNCLVLDDAYSEAEHGLYFEALARFVCDGLDACGYAYCPGGMMAATDAWRQPRRRWAAYFRHWIQEPDPTALMLTTVFFDMRRVHGSEALLAELRRDVLRQAAAQRTFLANMVGLALAHQPALGLFGQLAPIRAREHAGTIDLKHSGVVPIVDLARVCALAAGLEAVNTHERLERAAESREISEHDARALRDALEFLGALRLHHQARQIADGREPDNFVALDELSSFERSQLRDAFSVVQSLQKVLGQRFR